MVVRQGLYLVHQTDYINYSVVGSPDRRFLWILSRNPEMCGNVYDQLFDFVKELGYDVKRIEIFEEAVVDCPYDPSASFTTDLPRS